MRVYSIIPARSGSKGVKNKNKRIILDKMLIEYSIESSIESKLICDTIVTSDDTEILNLKNRYKSVYFHKRDKSLSSDTSPISDTIFELIKIYNIDSEDIIILLQPTAPIRRRNDIDDAINSLKNNLNANSLVSVLKMDDIHPARMYNKKDKYLFSLNADFDSSRRQDLKPVYYRNGAIYAFRVDSFINSKKITSEPILAFEMPLITWLNIDDRRDILIAEPLIKEWKGIW